MEKDTVTNFLLYNLLGITLDDEEKTCVYACIMKAYHDATNQGAYNTQIKGLDEISNKARKNAASRLYNECRKYFVQQNNQKHNFDEWHKKLCKDLVDDYIVVREKCTNIFTYGNAQKWVNMTLKYLDLLVSMGMLKSYKKLIEKNRFGFHIPVDSYILSALWKDERITSDLKEKFPCGDKHNHNFSKVTVWSKWSSYDTYKNFKNDVIDKLMTQKNPFDYENEIWVEEAKQRKKIEDRIKDFF